MNQLLPLANHLWQSTLFAALAGVITLFLRGNRAQVRYGLWLSASVKFLLPFSILVAGGGLLGRHNAPAIAPSQTAAAVLSYFIEQASAPFPAPLSQVAMPAHEASFASALAIVLIAVWAIGFVALLCRWILGWWRMRACVRKAIPLDLPVGLPARSSPAFGEPGVFGIIRPVLLLPDAIQDCLTAREMEAIVAHELCHVRRRDNLAAAIHMAVEALFWFHPLVWWLEARMMEERERACDEEVLRAGLEPVIYAEGILKICELYLASPLECVAGVTGGNLKKRIEAIVSHRAALRLSFVKKAAVTAAGVAAVLAPVMVGMAHAPAVRAQSAPLAASSGDQALPRFEVASIKRTASSLARDPWGIGFVSAIGHGPIQVLGKMNIREFPLKWLIMVAYNVKDFQVVGAPAWANLDGYEVIAKAENEKATFEQMRPMLQSLLADRFALTLRHETRELPIYELVAAKGGLKIEAAKAGSCAPFEANAPRPRLDAAHPTPHPKICGGWWRGVASGAPDRRDWLEGLGITMPRLIEIISPEIGRVIVDKTGFPKTFNFRLEFAPNPAMTGGPPPVDASGASANLSGVTIFTALQQQLGLRLESAKGPVDVLVIDHVERPSGN